MVTCLGRFPNNGMRLSIRWLVEQCTRRRWPCPATGTGLAPAVPLLTWQLGRLPVQAALDQVVHDVQSEPDQEEYPRPQEDGAFLLYEEDYDGHDGEDRDHGGSRKVRVVHPVAAQDQNGDVH